MARPSLELTVEVTGADGTQHRWGPGSRAGHIPQGLSFRTKQSEGFADANLTLSRRIDRDYVDLGLLDSVVIAGADGTIAYEGRVSAMPRSMQDTHTIGVQAVGWMAHTRDRKASEVYVDRDLSTWGGISRTRRADLLTTNFRDPQDGSVQTDATSALPALSLSFSNAWVSPYKPISEALYDAGPGVQIAKVYYDRDATATVNLADANWKLELHNSADDQAASSPDTYDLRTASATGYFTIATPLRYVTAQLWYSTSPAGAADQTYQLRLRNLTEYGDHGLPLIGDTDPKGVAASDVIRHVIGKYCPLLNTSGVQPTTYPIPHLAFHDRTDPYDVLLEVNKYHLWQFGVYDNRTLEFGPVDMSDYDWEVRLSDHGVKIELQGDSATDLYNGIVVTYQNVASGREDILTPDGHPELKDPSVENPANLAGINKWMEISLSSPSTQEAALQIGRATLAENNQPKAPGTISVQGYIRDRAGHWQPVWKVRNGDRVIIADHANDRPRLVVETDYQHDSKTVSIAVDSSFKRLDAVLDRLGTALRAANLAA